MELFWLKLGWGCMEAKPAEAPPYLCNHFLGTILVLGLNILTWVFSHSINSLLINMGYGYIFSE